MATTRSEADLTMAVAQATTLSELARLAGGCRNCPLWEKGTQTVFGEGKENARVVLVGEQPGDREDLAGRPFVGPAGRLLDRALELAGIDRRQVYLTNAVKHFKWEPRGKRRIHQKPSAREIAACQMWIEAELKCIQPRALVCLGATACYSLLGPAFRLTQNRGRIFESPRAPFTMATVHPSAILRIREDADRASEFERFVAELGGLHRVIGNQ
jgi:DNA polymerase